MKAINRQLIVDEKFTSIQEAQAGLSNLLAKAEKENGFYRVLKNNKPVGVLLPNRTWESLLEDLEALGSKKYLSQIRQARLEKRTLSASQARKRLGIS